MKFYVPNLETTDANFYQAVGVVNNENNSPSDDSILDSGWVQTDDTDEFNNYTEEY